MRVVMKLLRLVGALGLLGFAMQAHAEPYLAAQMGLKCVQCHVNPSGGGLRNVYGNVFAQTQLAARRIGAEEDLWNGQVMKFLSVGGNARANWSFSDVPDVGSTHDFAVEEARAYLDFGVIPNRLSVYLDQRFAPGNATNLEANVRYWFKENEYYVKAGRLYLPFGYRFEDDNTFVRSLSGINMQAPDEGVEFGIEKGAWSTQFALSNGTGGAPEVDGGKLLAVRTEFVQPVWRAGVSAVSNQTDAGDRLGVGVFGAWRVGAVTLLGEVDWIDDDSIGVEGRQLLGSLVEADWKIRQGHNLKFMFEWLEPNRDVDEDEQTRGSLLYEWAPIQFVQIRAGVRVYDGIPQNDLQNRKQAFLQLHGFF
jgi:hypothetical protein